MTQRQGPTASVGSSLGKLGMTGFMFDLAELRADLAGADAMLVGPESDGLLAAPGGWFGGGTSQVQRNIIGERILGLPREPRPAELSCSGPGAGGRPASRGGGPGANPPPIDEDVAGRHRLRAAGVDEVLVAGHPGRRPSTWTCSSVTMNWRRWGPSKSANQRRRDRGPAAEDRPARVHAGDPIGVLPDVGHGVEVACLERGVERGVGRAHGGGRWVLAVAPSRGRP